MAHLMTGHPCVFNDLLHTGVELRLEALLVIKRPVQLLKEHHRNNRDSPVGARIEAAVGLPLGVRRGEGVGDAVGVHVLRANEV